MRVRTESERHEMDLENLGLYLMRTTHDEMKVRKQYFNQIKK